MQKNLIAALAVGTACGGAWAQSITLSGLVDAYVGSMQSSGSKRVSAVNSSGMSTSWWGMEGREDLGGGLKAEFKVGGYLRNDTGATGRFNGNETFFSRNAYVGLAGDFGTVRLGRDGAPNFLPTALFNAFGDSFTFSPIVVHANVPLFNGTGWESVNAGDTGWSNQIRYTTPNFGGLTGNLHYQFGEVAGNNSNRNIGASFLYFQGRFGLGGFVHRVRMDNPLAGTVGNIKLGFSQQDAWMLSGKAGWGQANFYANYEQAKNNNYAGAPGEAKSKTWSLSADYAVGQGKVLAGFASTKWTGTPGVVLDGRKRDTLSLGYDHNLSKRTDLYAVYMNDKITGFNNGNSYAVGVRHRF
ncbi:MAG: porin [Proteobacteria bacterium]|nr:porin [Pseudomonadota bacterium]